MHRLVLGQLGEQDTHHSHSQVTAREMNTSRVFPILVFEADFGRAYWLHLLAWSWLIERWAIHSEVRNGSHSLDVQE